MPNYLITPNMNLPVPIPGVAPGPEYATDVNSCMTLIDQHDHSSGNGVQITPSGLNINADLSVNDNNVTAFRSARFQAQGGVLVGGSDLRCLYAVSADLYYNDGNGNNIRLTQSGAIAGPPGSISNLVSPASASYSSVSKTFIWQSDVNTPANMDAASYILRNLIVNSNSLTLQPPNSMASSYSIVLPTLPMSTMPLQLDAIGNMSTAQITLAQLVAAVQQSLCPPGAIVSYGGVSAPSGWLLCDGTSYLRATYPNLYTAIGNAYGTADGTHFNVPDFRGRFLRGTDNGAGNDPDAASRTAINTGGNTGDNVGSLQSDQFAAHTHTYSVGSSANGPLGLQANTVVNSGSTAASGGNETRPRNAYVNFIIKV